MAQVQTDDGTIEVAASDITFGDDEVPNGFVTQEKMNEAIKTRQGRELRSTLSSLGLNPSQFEGDDGNIDKTALTSDAAFRALAKAQGYKVDDDGTLSGTAADEEAQELRRKLSELESAADRAESLQSEVQSLRSTQAQNAILQHAGGIKDDLRDAFVQIATESMQYDEDAGRHVAVDENGNPIYADGEPAGAEHVVSQLQESRPSFFRDTSMNGGPDDTPGGEGGGPKTVSQEEFLSKAETMSPKEFRQYEQTVEIDE